MLASMKMTAFWDFVLCSPVELSEGWTVLHDERLCNNDTYLSHGTKYLYDTTWWHIPEGCHLRKLRHLVIFSIFGLLYFYCFFFLRHFHFMWIISPMLKYILWALNITNRTPWNIHDYLQQSVIWEPNPYESISVFTHLTLFLFLSHGFCSQHLASLNFFSPNEKTQSHTQDVPSKNIKRREGSFLLVWFSHEKVSAQETTSHTTLDLKVCSSFISQQMSAGDGTTDSQHIRYHDK
jgi:hypothetical protein